MTATDAEARFSVYLPAGWWRLDLTGPEDAAATRISELASTMVKAAPPSRQPAVRSMLESTLVPTLRALAAQDVVCVLLPVAPAAQISGGMITVRPWTLEDDQDPVAVVQAQALVDPSAQVVERDDLISVRFETSADITDRAEELAGPALREVSGPAGTTGDPLAGLDLDGVRTISRRIRYVVGDLTDQARWVDLQLAVDHASTRNGRELADGTAALFDSVAATFRWLA